MLKDLVLRNRSYRSYDESRRISKEELLALVDITRYTASGVNLQPLKYSIAWEEGQVAAIQALTRWAGKLPQMQLPPEGMRPTAFVVICQDTALTPSANGCLVDIGIAAQTLLLAAVEAGLGGCMLGSFNAQELTRLLSLPEGVVPKLVIALGLPKEDVRLTGVGADGSTDYYRDAEGVHWVPKRALEDILL